MLEPQFCSQVIRATSKNIFISPLLFLKKVYFPCSSVQPLRTRHPLIFFWTDQGFSLRELQDCAISWDLGQCNNYETPYLQSDNFTALHTIGGFFFLSPWADPEATGELSLCSVLGTSHWTPTKCIKFFNTVKQ